MAAFTANKPMKTVTIHKNGCRVIPNQKLKTCGCGETGDLGNQQWWCEEHITAGEIDEFLNHRHWALMVCDTCFAE